MRSIVEIIGEEISAYNKTVFTELPDDIFQRLRLRKFSDAANRSHMKLYKAKDGKHYLIRKSINQDVFNVYRLDNLNFPIATAVYDEQQDYFTGYEHQQSIKVEPMFQRLGFATALTDFAETIYNKPYKPTKVLSEPMQGFVKDRFKEGLADKYTEKTFGVQDKEQERQAISADNSFNQNFWQWFGQSKVVDKQGNPLRVYHGTQADFNSFKSETGLMYFSQTPKYASQFATNREIKRTVDDSQPSVMPVYLSIQKPLDLLEFKTEIISRYEFGGKLDDLGIEINSDNLKDYPMGLNMGEDVRVWQWLRFNAKYLLPIIKASGYDGIFMYEHAETGGKTIQDIAYVIFEPQQAKSATGNNQEFDRSNPDITKESIKEQLISELTMLTESTDEGVADRYAEKQFNINDPNTQMNLKAMQGILGKPFANIYRQNIQVPVYLNPKTLEGFDKDVRAIADVNGNLYVMQIDADIMHGSMGVKIGLSEKIYNNSNYQLLQRIADENAFGLGDSGISNIEYSQQNWLKGLDVLRKTKAKNPDYDFYPRYYRDVLLHGGIPVNANGDDGLENPKDEYEKKFTDEGVAAKKKNLQMNFIPKYWQYIISDRNENNNLQEHIIKDNNLQEHIIKDNLQQDNQPRILQVIDDYLKASKTANEFINTESSKWNGSFNNAMSPRAGVQYQEYMKNQPKIDDRNAKAKQLQDAAQVLADEIKKDYLWIFKATRGKNMPKYANLDDMINYFRKKFL